MNNFLTLPDYLVFITQGALQKILRDNETKLTDSERMAYGYVYEKLSASFNLDAEILDSLERRYTSMLSLDELSTEMIFDVDIPKR